MDPDHARELAGRLLAEPLPDRWSHSRGVGRAAESVSHLVDADAENLICAAWLHDIGYAPDLISTGMHQLDGARYLRDVARVDARICRLVAHHSCARIEARNRGLSDQLADEFPAVEGLVTDALTFADMTTSPVGEPVDVADRLAEILSRYDDSSVVAMSISEAAPLIISSVDRVTALLTEE